MEMEAAKESPLCAAGSLETNGLAENTEMYNRTFQNRINAENTVSYKTDFSGIEFKDSGMIMRL